MSWPPQAPGPIRRGIGAMAAIAAIRKLQSDGLLVTSAELKSGPAASRKLIGSTQFGGRGRGSGISSAVAMLPETARKIIAMSARTGAMSGTIAAIMRDQRQSQTGNSPKP